MLIQQIKTELAKLGIRPKKSLGQNFLINENTYKKIADILELKPSDTVVEVGPGLGTLTERLFGLASKIIAVEKDKNLVAYLKNKFDDQKENIEIIENDILKFDPMSYKLQITGYKLVGNIPYYLSSHLLRIVFEEWPKPESIVFMVQKEVAKRITAKPPEMSLLAVSIQYFAKAEIAGMVSKANFYPQPKVDSAIIKIRPGLDIKSKKAEVNFFKVVKAGFSAKRKQLINNLSGGLKLNKENLNFILLSLGILPQRRAETLTIDEWQKITDTLGSRD